MANDTIFFSYSRDDSMFVMELAKDLRAAGATVWLDQLDIQPGTHWDSSVEKALQESNTLLVVLSNSSVKSHNVMDEVSYALEENKKVVPLLKENCQIPFRLRRLQYADFSGNRETGLKHLVDALELERNVADKLVESKSDRPDPTPTPKPTPKPEPTPTPNSITGNSQQVHQQTGKPNLPKKSNNTTYYVLGGCFVLFLIVIFLLMVMGYIWGGADAVDYDYGY
ncbi:MAG TPA: toll/interleukin-1 receptor domain-containing protein [Aequorivita sp.]|nr:toll/interleukin-1 receptor domain-containing protein [Aequorivita sp.]